MCIPLKCNDVDVQNSKCVGLNANHDRTTSSSIDSDGVVFYSSSSSGEAMNHAFAHKLLSRVLLSK